MTSSQSSLQSTNIDLSPTGSLTSSPAKIRPKVASFKFQKPSTINKPTPIEHGENINIKQHEKNMSEKNRVESPPAAIYLTQGGPVTSSGSSGIFLRKSPESMSTFRPQSSGIATTKIRPKSVCERPMVAPPSVPPRPSLTPKQYKAEIEHQNSKQQKQLSSNDNNQLIDKYPELNHIDSESDDQNSRSSKDLSDPSLQQKTLIHFKKDSESIDDEQHSSMYPSLDEMMKKENHEDDEIKISKEPESSKATTPPPPHKPPRTHSSNSSSGSSSNLSMNESMLDTNLSLSSRKKQHQRSASTSILTSNNNNNNNPDIDDNSKLNPNSIKIQSTKTDNQTYL
ncbi:hypothetical protein BLA29_001356 [Euroglyphus maynei]|uniref:Uncharacterized protein n=1 Tax=Euroglyphus maynei TaxID=6958 RepID=A0A1Y3BDZ9_EURMA|nr:hypothetical protein BLA29_001356 [Euroglyphus maynei]